MLDRATDLDNLHNWFRDVQSENGRLIFVSGEMGIGKTTLIDTFVRQITSPVVVASLPFDGLSIPTPLGPLLDLTRSLGHDVQSLTAGQSPRSSVFRAIETSIRETPTPTVIIAEDAHWADEASLEFIRFLGRRISSLRAMLIVTYRDDELSPGHPLRQVLGDLATERSVRRIAVAPLSVEAVRILAVGSSIDSAKLHAYTGGNAFFVTEILATGKDTPVPIAEAVLGRASRLEVEARQTLDAAAVIGARIDPLFLAGIIGRLIERDIAAAFEAGLLRSDGNAIVFRHAAVQSVIIEAMSPARTVTLHQSILDYCDRNPGANVTVARLAFHAEQAHNRSAAHHYALEAATEATHLQSHREAADQYARALRCAGDIPPHVRAEILESHAFACFLTSLIDAAIVSQQDAADIWQTLGNQLRYGHNLRRLSRYWFFNGRHLAGLKLAEEAFAVLGAFPESSEFAMACGYLAEWRIRAERLAEARELANLAIRIADAIDDPETTIHALITVGMVQLAMGELAGSSTLRSALSLAQEIGHEEFELRALTHLSEAYDSHRFRSESRPYAEAGLTLARTRDFSTMIALYGSVRLTMLLDACDWPTAIAESADLIDNNGGNAGRLLLIAHLVWVRARLRCGQGDPSDLELALRHAVTLDDPVAQAMVMSAHLESAWLSGTLPAGIDTALALLGETRAASDTRTASELALWLSRTDSLPVVPVWLVEPYASEIHGNPMEAAAIWTSTGVPLESLRAQSRSDDRSDLLRTHAGFITLGAGPDALRVAHRMQALGYRGVPRGPRPSTRSNPALLSRREVEILSLMAEGVTNREMAMQLSISPKTVDHHVSAILGKLRAANRQQAVVRARDTGILPR